MSKLIFILGDQLNRQISSLAKADPKQDIVFLCEVNNEAEYVPHHQQKLVLIFSAMRHFAAELTKQGFKVDYVKLTDADNQQHFTKELARAVQRHPEVTEIVIAQPAEYRVLTMVKTWQKKFKRPVTITPDNRFLATAEDFNAWAKGRKQLRMEFFYRFMRQRYDILMEGDQPVGGKWNYDQQNRKVPKAGVKLPAPLRFKQDEITQQVLELVKQRFAKHFGELEAFNFAVTRKQALAALKHFITQCLPQFGDYQDAMLQDQPFLFHSLISPYINCGLLMPLECIEAAQAAYQQGQAPLNAVEGFIRQILGWREYVRGIYWLKMPSYAEQNYFKAKRDLPEFYWHGQTKMACLQDCVRSTKRHAYAHHIQRLMVLGNFALLAGIDPTQVNQWFLVVYADAYEWVELPNVTGMALFADGGLLASKPYAASGAYINKMSNYCKSCHYAVKEKTGAAACPFNYLYWDFLMRHDKVLRSNQRMRMIYSTLDKMDSDKQQAIKRSAKEFFKRLEQQEV